LRPTWCRPRSLLALGLLAWLLPSCVDLTEPWKKGKGGAGGGAGGGGEGGGAPLDAELPDAPARGGTGGTSGIDGMGPLDTAGADGTIDVALGDTGVSLDSGSVSEAGALDVGVAEAGDKLDTSAGGAGGGRGGAGGRGGSGGSGGTTVSDAAPDTRDTAVPDAPLDVAPDVGPDLGPDLGLASGLVAYYPCEQASGTTLPDLSGQGNDGTLASAPPAGETPPAGHAFQAGKVGQALTLDPAGGGYVSVPIGVFKNAKDLTIAAWIRGTAPDPFFQRIFDLGINAHLAQNAPTGTAYMTFLLADPFNNGEHSVSSTTDGYNNATKISAASSAIPQDAWRHLAVVMADGGAVLYIDGAQVGEASSMPTPRDLGNIDYAYFGWSQFTDDPFFAGQLDELRVYRRAL